MATHDRRSTNQVCKTELEFYLRLFEKAERDLKKKAQSEATQAAQSTTSREGAALNQNNSETGQTRVWTSPQACPPIAWAGFSALNKEGTLPPITCTRFHFLYRIDMWSIDDAKVIEHLAGV